VIQHLPAVLIIVARLRSGPSTRCLPWPPEHHGLGCGLFHTERPQAGHRLRQMDSIRDNLQAVAKTIEARAGLNVGGRGDGQPFQGFTAIPASATCQDNHPAPVDAASEPSGPRSTNTPTASELYRGNQPLLAGRQVLNCAVVSQRAAYRLAQQIPAVFRSTQYIALACNLAALYSIPGDGHNIDIAGHAL
jgi:hypothetical protein